MASDFTAQELMQELEQSLNKIEFLYGCLTKPNYKFAYPKMTEEHIERLRKIVGPRNYCTHSNVRPECPSCLEGHKARMILASTDEKVTRIGLLEQELVEWKDKPAKALPRLVVCAILIRNGKVLLERRAPAGVAGLDGKWDLPGGKVECGEEPEDAIRREIKEELGIAVHPVKLIPYLPISTWKYHDGEQRHWILVAYVCAFSEEPVLTDTLQWFSMDEVGKIDILAADLQLLRMV